MKCFLVPTPFKMILQWKRKKILSQLHPVGGTTLPFLPTEVVLLPSCTASTRGPDPVAPVVDAPHSLLPAVPFLYPIPPSDARPQTWLGQRSQGVDTL